MKFSSSLNSVQTDNNTKFQSSFLDVTCHALSRYVLHIFAVYKITSLTYKNTFLFIYLSQQMVSLKSGLMMLLIIYSTCMVIISFPIPEQLSQEVVLVYFFVTVLNLKEDMILNSTYCDVLTMRKILSAVLTNPPTLILNYSMMKLTKSLPKLALRINYVFSLVTIIISIFLVLTHTTPQESSLFYVFQLFLSFDL